MTRRGGSTGRSFQRLLASALRELNREQLAMAIGVAPMELQRWSEIPDSLTFPQETATVFAVLTMAPEASDLFRAAATLRSRLASQLEYEFGVTKADGEAPVRWFGV